MRARRAIPLLPAAPDRPGDAKSVRPSPTPGDWRRSSTNATTLPARWRPSGRNSPWPANAGLPVWGLSESITVVVETLSCGIGRLRRGFAVTPNHLRRSPVGTPPGRARRTATAAALRLGVRDRSNRPAPVRDRVVRHARVPVPADDRSHRPPCWRRCDKARRANFPAPRPALAARDERNLPGRCPRHPGRRACSASNGESPPRSGGRCRRCPMDVAASSRISAQPPRPNASAFPAPFAAPCVSSTRGRCR